MSRYSLSNPGRGVGSFYTASCERIVPYNFAFRQRNKYSCHTSSLVNEGESLKPVIQIRLSAIKLINCRLAGPVCEVLRTGSRMSPILAVEKVRLFREQLRKPRLRNRRTFEQILKSCP